MLVIGEAQLVVASILKVISSHGTVSDITVDFSLLLSLNILLQVVVLNWFVRKTYLMTMRLMKKICLFVVIIRVQSISQEILFNTLERAHKYVSLLH